jgi:hypothetical protein
MIFDDVNLMFSLRSEAAGHTEPYSAHTDNGHP